MVWYKKASKSSNVPQIENAGKLQDSWSINLGDYQRWIVDAYIASVFITKTKYKISVSVNVNKVHLGTIMLQIFWKYDLNEEQQARKTYNKLCSVIKEIFNKMSDEETPSSLYESMIRSDCAKIDPKKLAKTTIPHINWANEYGNYERDWRVSLYGNRYPGPNETNAF